MEKTRDESREIFQYSGNTLIRYIGEEVADTVIPDSVEYISAGAFRGAKLKSITIGKNVRAIGKGAFRGAIIDTVIVPSLESWVKISFADRDANPMSASGEGLLFPGDEGDRCILGDGTSARYKTVILPSADGSILPFSFTGRFASCTDNIELDGKDKRVVNVDSFAFVGLRCGSAKIHFPASLKSIGVRSFEDTPGIVSAEIDKDNKTFDVDCNEGYSAVMKITEKEKRELVKVFFSGEPRVSLLPSVTSICEYAMSGITVESLFISDGIERIGAFAFYGCEIKGRLQLPGPDKWSRVELSGSQSNPICAAIRTEDSTVFLGPNDKNGFLEGRDSVLRITAGAVGEECFRGLRGLREVLFLTPDGDYSKDGARIGAFAFAETDLQRVSYDGGSIDFIDDCAFYGCTGLADVQNLSDGYVILYPIGSADTKNVIRLLARRSRENSKDVSVIGVFASCEDSCFDGTLNLGAFTDRVGWIQNSKENYRISSVADGAFCGNKDIKEVIFPSDDGLKVGKFAFSGCSSIVKLSFGITSPVFGDGAFYGCTGIETVSVQSGFSGIERLPKRDFASVKEYQVTESMPGVPRRVRSVEGVLFTSDGNTLLRYGGGRPDAEYIIPGGVTTIAPYAFAHSEFLKSVRGKRGKGGRKIRVGDHAFEKCGALTDISYFKKAAEIGNYAFFGCNSIKEVKLRGTKRIGVCAFAENGALETVDVGRCPNVSDFAFEKCRNLERVRLRSEGALRGFVYRIIRILGKHNKGDGISCSILGEGAFRGCEKLGTVRLSGFVGDISDRAFSGCKSLRFFTLSKFSTVYNVGKCAFANAFSEVSGESDTCRISLPAERVQEGAFSGCSALESVNFGYRLPIFSGYVFSGCTSLRRIEYVKDRPSVPAGCFFGCRSLDYSFVSEFIKNKTELSGLSFAHCKIEGPIELSDGVKRVGEELFFGSSVSDVARIIYKDNESTLHSGFAPGWNRIARGGGELYIPVEKKEANTGRDAKSRFAYAVGAALRSVGDLFCEAWRHLCYGCDSVANAFLTPFRRLCDYFKYRSKKK